MRYVTKLFSFFHFTISPLAIMTIIGIRKLATLANSSFANSMVMDNTVVKLNTNILFSSSLKKLRNDLIRAKKNITSTGNPMNMKKNNVEFPIFHTSGFNELRCQ